MIEKTQMLAIFSNHPLYKRQLSSTWNCFDLFNEGCISTWTIFSYIHVTKIKALYAYYFGVSKRRKFKMVIFPIIFLCLDVAVWRRKDTLFSEFLHMYLFDVYPYIHVCHPQIILVSSHSGMKYSSMCQNQFGILLLEIYNSQKLSF